MKELAKNILDIVEDYRNEDGIQLTVESIIAWAEQFGDDAEFMLAEILHLLPSTYFSRNTAKELTRNGLKTYTEKAGSVTAFLSETEFLDLQSEGKSQGAILKLVEEVLNEDYGQSYHDYSSFPKTNFIYFDDVLATGGTIGRQLIEWLNKSSGDVQNHVRVLKGEYKLSVRLFCMHNWGFNFQNYRIEKTFSSALAAKIGWFYNMEIQNHIKWREQQLNIVIPKNEQPQNVKTYLAGLEAEKYEDYAYRPSGQPTKEIFFSSPENRVRYENNLLQKGLEIINMIHGPIGVNVRPLGFVNPNYKTLGLGTHFFTWRNIPNNCPLALWWEVHGHDWKPLFPIHRS